MHAILRRPFERSGAITITKGGAFSKAWESYNKICVCEQAPYYHFQVGFRAAWLACTALNKAERRKTVARARAVQQLQAKIAALVPEFSHVITINQFHNDRLTGLVIKLRQLSALQ